MVSDGSLNSSFDVEIKEVIPKYSFLSHTQKVAQKSPDSVYLTNAMTAQLMTKSHKQNHMC